MMVSWQVSTTAATDSSNVGDYFITVNYEDSAGRLANYDVNLVSDNRVSITAVANVEVLNGSSVVNDSDLDDCRRSQCHTYKFVSLGSRLRQPS